MKKITLLIALFFCAITFLRAQDPVTYQQAFPNLSFEYPVEIQNAKDGSNRLFVVEQSGRIKVFQNSSNTTQQQVFLDLRNQISFSAGQEIGLLGLAFHPNYSQNGYFYVYHTRASSVPGISTEMVLARYRVGSNSNQADSSSRFEIFSFDKNQNNSNHNGGKIGFGPDGYLYVSIGDGGGGGDPQGNSQNLNTVFGSILRIDIDVNGNNPLESNPDTPNGRYEIPSDNPRRGQSGLDELYAWGIRNTWKFSFDNVTGRMWGADVGQNRFEEINLIQKGGNYGWNRFEANASQNTSTNLATTPDIKPVFYYGRENGDISITGGYVYRGSSPNTNIQGKYIYADYVSGRVWALDYNASNNSATSRLLFRTSGEYVSSFGLDESGEIYFSGYGTSAKIFKINGGSNPPPPPGPVTVEVDGVGDWKELENGTNGIVEAVVTEGDDIFIGGSFSNAGGTNVNNIAWYNKNDGWKNLSSGANGVVYALALASDGKLYAGGTFTSIGGVAAQNIAVWNGSSWSAIGSGTNGKVAKIGIDDNNNVYVGGTFTTAGGISVNNIARWNNGWAALRDSGTSISGTNNEIRAIAFDTNNTLYVGGNFDSAGGRSANRIATWNGSNWGTLGTGTSGFVQAIVVTPQSVYAGGNFTQAGGKTVNRIARWVKSSSSWQAMGNGVSGNINALDFDGTYVYAGGNFETAANDTSTNFIIKSMARWSIAQGWQALGPGKSVGVNNLINDLDLSDNNQRLYVGGNYGVAGNITARNIGIWSPQGFDCTDERLIAEYQINGTWSSGESTITVDEGTRVVLSLLPNNLSFTITSPSGNVVNGDYDLGNVSQTSEGSYTIRTAGGCETSINVVVNSSTDPCTADSVKPEYRLNGGSWIDAGSKITVDEGDDIVLGIKPDATDFTITLPSGTSVNNDYTINGISLTQGGIYVFRTSEDCTASLEIDVIEDTVPCTASSVIPEYRIGNGEWLSGVNETTVDKGTTISLGIKPDNTQFSIELPNGTSVSGDYTINNIQPSQAGTYTFTTVDGCTATFVITVIDDEVVCDENSIIPEYRIEGVWSSGASKIDVPVGTPVVLSMLPNNIAFTITLPNGNTVDGDYSLGAVTTGLSGVYLITSIEGCSTNLEINVFDDSVCNEEVIPQYRIDGVWSQGEDRIEVGEGSDVFLSMIPEGNGSITLPDGSQVGEGLDLGNITIDQGGIYTFATAEGCSATLEIAVIADSLCQPGSIIPEYRLNGIWSSGQTSISIDSGTNVTLSILPNNVDLVITLPNGTEVGDNYDLGSVDSTDAGTYLFETLEGCRATLTISINESSNCVGNPIINEYRINERWSSGGDVLNLTEGTKLALSILPNGIPVTITAPDGEEYGDNYNLGRITAEQSGTYTLTTADCTSTITLNVTEDVDPCSLGGIIPEYQIDGVWLSGDTEINVDEGTNIVLSMLPNAINLTIIKPDGTVVDDNYDLGNVMPEQSGVYILDAGNGCTEAFTLNVRDMPNCSSETIIPEYRINGLWESGANYLRVQEGTEVILSILPNNVGVAITLPDGSQVGDNYNLGNVTAANNGIYVFTSTQGCKTTLELFVPQNGGGESKDLDTFGSDFTLFNPNGETAEDIIAYPNPTTDRITVDLKGLANKRFILILTDMRQQQLFVKEFDENHDNQTELSLGTFSSGIYFLVFKQENGPVTTKRIIKK